MRNKIKRYSAKLLALPLVFVLAGCEMENTEHEPDKQAITNVSVGLKKDGLSGEQLFAVCQACHNLSKGEPHKVGPNLYGMMGQPAASREGYVYSEALTNSGIVWNKGLLLGWVLSAENMVPKTWMVYHNHLSVENTEKLVDYVIAKASE